MDDRQRSERPGERQRAADADRLSLCARERRQGERRQNGASGRERPASVDFHACSSSGCGFILSIRQCIVNRSMTRPKRRGIQSIDTGIRLLEVLEKADGPLALKELSAQAELDPSGAHRYLASFARCGLVAQGADSRYDFGPLALRLGLAAIQRSDPVQADRARAARSGRRNRAAPRCSRCGATAARPSCTGSATGNFVTSLNLGSVLPVARSSIGRMLLAFLPQGVTAETLAYEAKREKIDRECARARARARAQGAPRLRRQDGHPRSVRGRQRGAAAGTARRPAPSRSSGRTPSSPARTIPPRSRCAPCATGFRAKSGAPDLKIAA